MDPLSVGLVHIRPEVALVLQAKKLRQGNLLSIDLQRLFHHQGWSSGSKVNREQAGLYSYFCGDLINRQGHR